MGTVAIACAVALIAGALALGGFRAAWAQGESPCVVNDFGVLGAEPDSELQTQGRWTTEGCDSHFRIDSDSHTYRFEVVEGGRIRIDLMSAEGDSYLYLLAEDGSRITDNDDGGAGLLVVMDNVPNKRRASVEIRRSLGDLRVSKDIVVSTPDEITRRGHVAGTVLHAALREGTIVYERL